MFGLKIFNERGTKSPFPCGPPRPKMKECRSSLNWTPTFGIVAKSLLALHPVVSYMHAYFCVYIYIYGHGIFFDPTVI